MAKGIKIDVIGIIGRLSAIPRLIAALQVAQGEVTTLQHDPAIAEELKHCPLISARITLISADIRTIQNAATAVKKSSFFTIWSRVPALLLDLQKAQGDVVSTQGDPALLAELATAPHLSAAMVEVSREARTVEEAVHALVG